MDNATSVSGIKNMVIGPCFDTEGKLRGLIQLINKSGDDPISENDRIEIVNLCPTVAEIIKQADEVKYVLDLSNSITLHMYNSKEAMLKSTEAFESRDFAKIHSVMN